MEIRKLAPGDRILDYRVLERLGEGGFGEVFRAEHEVLGRIVAIKVPRDQNGLTALRHEGVVQASLDHPSIVNTLELSISHDPPYVVMDYIDGDSLAGLLKREGALPWRRAARILLEAAKALSYAHSKGVIHGDVKPGNLLVEPGRAGRVLLTDFGLGRVFEGPQGNLQISRSLELATSGAEVQGTIRYLAPELLRGESADERADIYSFAVLLFEAVTGRVPEGREVPSDLTKHLPPEFDQIFTRQFTRRERRPRSLDEAIADLEGLLDPKRKKAAKQSEPKTVVRAIPADAPTNKSASRHARRPESETEETCWATRLAEVRNGAGFTRWRDGLCAQLQRRMSPHRSVATCEPRGFDICFGVTAEGEPHHRIYCLVLPKLDPATARATVAEARRVFDLEKGIWEKEVTFWILAQEVEEQDQVLWAFKSFSMGWWRRRRIVLQDVGNDRLFATELGCDPRGNPLKRAFLAASQAAIQSVPRAPKPVLVASGRNRCLRGTAWGAALALLMTFGLLGSIMALDLASQRLRSVKPAAVLETPTTTDDAQSAAVAAPDAPCFVDPVKPAGRSAKLLGPTRVRVQKTKQPAAEPATVAPLPARQPDRFLPQEPSLPRYY